MSEDHCADRKIAAPIQMTMAAFFSDMTGVGFISRITAT
jgi:hypothetical protein